MLLLRVWILAGTAMVLLSSCGGDRLARKVAEEEKAPLIVKTDTWRGGLIGGAWGASFSGDVFTAVERAVLQAAKEDRPTAYVSSDGFQRVEVYPQEVRQRTLEGCRMVRVLLFQTGRKVGEETKKVCPP